MRGSYCSSEPRTPTPENPETCELEEIEKARDFMQVLKNFCSDFYLRWVWFSVLILTPLFLRTCLRRMMMKRPEMQWLDWLIWSTPLFLSTQVSALTQLDFVLSLICLSLVLKWVLLSQLCPISTSPLSQLGLSFSPLFYSKVGLLC